MKRLVVPLIIFLYTFPISFFPATSQAIVCGGRSDIGTVGQKLPDGSYTLLNDLNIVSIDSTDQTNIATYSQVAHAYLKAADKNTTIYTDMNKPSIRLEGLSQNKEFNAKDAEGAPIHVSSGDIVIISGLYPPCGNGPSIVVFDAQATPKYALMITESNNSSQTLLYESQKLSIALNSDEHTCTTKTKNGIEILGPFTTKTCNVSASFTTGDKTLTLQSNQKRSMNSGNFTEIFLAMAQIASTTNVAEGRNTTDYATEYAISFGNNLLDTPIPALIPKILDSSPASSKNVVADLMVNLINLIKRLFGR